MKKLILLSILIVFIGYCTGCAYVPIGDSTYAVAPVYAQYYNPYGYNTYPYGYGGYGWGYGWGGGGCSYRTYYNPYNYGGGCYHGNGSINYTTTRCGYGSVSCGHH